MRGTGLRAWMAGRIGLCILTALLLASAPVFAQSDVGGGSESGVGSEGALFLLLPVGAEGVGMARAMTALSGPESVWWNPAGIVDVDRNSFLLFRSEDLSGEGTAASFLVRREGLGSAAISYLLFDLGDVDLRDDQGNFLGTVSFRNHLGILSAGTSLPWNLDVGVNLKLIQTRVTCRGQCTDAGVTATTYAIDAGAQWTLFRHLVLAGTVAHLGPRLQVFNEEQADPLPARLRIAAAYEVLHHWIQRPGLAARVVVEVEDRLRDPGSPARYIGTEIEAGTGPSLSLRAGYAFGSELQVDGAGVGVGLRYESFDLGISKSLTSTTLSGETEPVQITFGFVF